MSKTNETLANVCMFSCYVAACDGKLDYMLWTCAKRHWMYTSVIQWPASGNLVSICYRENKSTRTCRTRSKLETSISFYLCLYRYIVVLMLKKLLRKMAIKIQTILICLGAYYVYIATHKCDRFCARQNEHHTFHFTQ